jgi:hypothetical protein
MGHPSLSMCKKLQPQIEDEQSKPLVGRVYNPGNFLSLGEVLGGADVGGGAGGAGRRSGEVQTFRVSFSEPEWLQRGELGFDLVLLPADGLAVAPITSL